MKAKKRKEKISVENKCRGKKDSYRGPAKHSKRCEIGTLESCDKNDSRFRWQVQDQAGKDDRNRFYTAVIGIANDETEKEVVRRILKKRKSMLKSEVKIRRNDKK